MQVSLFFCESSKAVRLPENQETWVGSWKETLWVKIRPYKTCRQTKLLLEWVRKHLLPLHWPTDTLLLFVILLYAAPSITLYNAQFSFFSSCALLFAKFRWILVSLCLTRAFRVPHRQRKQSGVSLCISMIQLPQLWPVSYRTNCCMPQLVIMILNAAKTIINTTMYTYICKSMGILCAKINVCTHSLQPEMLQIRQLTFFFSVCPTLRNCSSDILQISVPLLGMSSEIFDNL